MSIASEAVAGWGTWGHRCDFLMHIYLISLNANDLPLNVWPPECVFHDTYPFQLLRRNCCLPMGSVVGNSIEWVDIRTSHELQISSLSCYDFFWTNYSQLCNLPKSHLEIPIYESHLPDFTLPEHSPKCACNISSLNLYICLRLLDMYESQLSVPTTPPPRSLEDQDHESIIDENNWWEHYESSPMTKFYIFVINVDKKIASVFKITPSPALFGSIQRFKMLK